MPHESAGLLDAHLHIGGLEPATATPSPLPFHSRWVNGTSPADWSQVAEAAFTRPEVMPFFGLHPWHATPEAVAENDGAPAWLHELERLLTLCPSGVGEIGLDRRRPGLDAAAQETALRQQLRLARKLHRPVSLHCVGAVDWLLRIFKEDGAPEAGFLAHSFNGSLQEIALLIRQGGYLSFSPRLLSLSPNKQRTLLTAVPPEHLFLESDAESPPPPVPLPLPTDDRAGIACLERPNVDARLAFYTAVAAILGTPLPQLQEQLAVNAQRFLSAPSC